MSTQVFLALPDNWIQIKTKKLKQMTAHFKKNFIKNVTKSSKVIDTLLSEIMNFKFK
jgi:hypothetical protein